MTPTALLQEFMQALWRITMEEPFSETVILEREGWGTSDTVAVIWFAKAIKDKL